MSHNFERCTKKISPNFPNPDFFCMKDMRSWIFYCLLLHDSFCVSEDGAKSLPLKILRHFLYDHVQSYAMFELDSTPFLKDRKRRYFLCLDFWAENKTSNYDKVTNYPKPHFFFHVWIELFIFKKTTQAPIFSVHLIWTLNDKMTAAAGIYFLDIRLLGQWLFVKIVGFF